MQSYTSKGLICTGGVTGLGQILKVAWMTVIHGKSMILTNDENSITLDVFARQPF